MTMARPAFDGQITLLLTRVPERAARDQATNRALRNFPYRAGVLRTGRAGRARIVCPFLTWSLTSVIPGSGPLWPENQ